MAKSTRKPGRPKSAAVASRVGRLTDLRGDKEEERTKLLRLEVRKRSGALVDRQIVGNAISMRSRLERDAHMAFVMRTAPIIAGEFGIDAGRLYALLDREMRAHLEALSRTAFDLLADDVAPRRRVG